MDKATKIWLIAAISLILLGIIAFVGAMFMLKWDFKGLSTNKFETNGYKIDEEFKSVSIYSDTADIKLVLSENSECSVVCRERTNEKHLVTVKDGALVIELVDTRKWYEHIGIFFETPEITVYLPQGEYGALLISSDTGDVEILRGFKFESIDVSESTGDVTCLASVSDFIKIKTDTGDIRIENASADTVDLSVSTGDISVTDLACKNLFSMGDTGDITLDRVIAEEKFSVERSTGDVKLQGCDAAEIFIVTDTGDVTGTLLSSKVFITKTDTGRTHVPNSVTGGRCEIITDTGDIEIFVK